MKITLKQIDQLTSTGAPAHLWDTELRGFGVKALKSGKKNYIVKYRVGGGRSAKQRWMKLGDCNVLKLPKAREQAQQVLAAASRGEDPQAEKREKNKYQTLNDAWERFEKEVLPNRKPSTASDYRSMWKLSIQPKLGKRDINKITQNDVSKLHRQLRDTPYRANRVLSVCSRLFNLCEAWGWKDQGMNPCKHVEKFSEKSRERYLSGEEIKALNQAMVSLVEQDKIHPQMRRIILLLLITGARKNEIIKCEWKWVDMDRSLILLPDSKTGKKTLYLADHAKQILFEQSHYSGDSKWVFPSTVMDSHLVNISKAWNKMRSLAGLEDVRIHDLRHTSASIAANEGFNAQAIAKVLGHAQTSTTERYTHLRDDAAFNVANTVGDFVKKSTSSSM